ncbi:asparaginyl-tRNA synthetase [Metamycoplasma subdolum]|uniref:Asparagine--tRNA ligase n=1 Tax=Metamycoplasma subdolum TaxID=92407 RepID=A0A3M0A084_9BACT|nr:asparagine--tRNA ligase [Metamycoplasma subdolum]RMA78531.1 asparaginyl-tRNA synthetase [Metamycoplasma subdolum]WPB50463.1 asparagine--tRNA ligase [Metamycoplasma subdolum]
MTVKQLFDKQDNLKNDQKFAFEGWVISNRGNNKLRFLVVNDGSTVNNLQVVVKGEEANEKFKIDDINLGTSIKIEGILKLTPEAKQPFELVADQVQIINLADNDFPIQKKEITLDFLREIPHLRAKTAIFKAVMLVRSRLMLEIHNYFQERGFLNISAPIITSNDGEGAGETLIVNDGSKDLFFKQKAFLGVTGQLHAEAYAQVFKKVYTFAPTFRAENSHTSRHLAEFWMMEPEVAFCNLKEIIHLADDMLKAVIKNTIKKQAAEIKYLDELQGGNLLDTLDKFLSKDLTILEYKKAIEILKENKKEFEEQNIYFGLDLASEHEKFLAEKIVKGPVAITNFPKEIKAFYMYQNKDKKTVAAFDLLAPGIGEIIGGSQREESYDKLAKRLAELKINQEPLQWYLDLRRFGYVGSSGFGLGFERLVMYVTGISNIRDVIPFPRVAGSIKM